MPSRCHRRRLCRVPVLLMPLALLALSTVFAPPPQAAADGHLAGISRDDGQMAGIPKTEYRARRQQLMSRIKDGIVLLIGAREDEFGEVAHFRQKNDFMYLTGVETPSAYL